MKFLAALILKAICLTPASLAADTGNLCETLISCGTFEGTSELGKSIRVEVTATGPRTARLNYDVLLNGEVAGNWPLEVTIGEEGLLTMRLDGRLCAAGVCEDKTCSYGMSPWQPRGRTETIGNAGIFKFYADRLELRMSWGTPSETGTDLTVLKKIN